MFFNKKKYDLIFGLGEACSCSFALRRANLQIHSFPFDWLFGATFLQRTDILVNNFENFIRLEDIECIGNNGIPTHLCDIYHNKYNNLGFNHDFLSGQNPKDVIDEIAQKYQRRANRLFELAKNSKKILVVWLDSPGANWMEKSDEDFIKCQQILQDKFNNTKVELLVFAWKKDLQFKNRTKEQLSEDVLKYSFDFQFHHKKKIVADYVVDEKMLMKILKNYELNMTLKEKIDNYFYKKQK